MVGFHELESNGRWRKKRGYTKTYGMGEMSVTWDPDLLVVSGVNTYTEIKDITELVQIT